MAPTTLSMPNYSLKNNRGWAVFLADGLGKGYLISRLEKGLRCVGKHCEHLPSTCKAPLHLSAGWT